MADTDTSSSGLSTPSRGRSKVGKFILVILLIAAVAGFIWAEKSRRDALHQLQQTNAQFQQLKKSTADSSQDTAKLVRDNVSKLIALPSDPPPTVATISDIDRLKASNAFFNAAQNGDYLILTGNRAILYNLQRNIILDVAPFQVNQPSATPTPSTSPKAKSSPEASPTK